MTCPHCHTPMDLVEPGERYSGPEFWICKGCDHQIDQQICTPCRHNRHQWCWGDHNRCDCPHKEKTMSKTPVPEFLWDEENECWIIKHGEITISFFEPGDLIVSGHEVTAQVTYDQITEERGLRFQDWKSRDYEHQIRKDSQIKEDDDGEV